MTRLKIELHKVGKTKNGEVILRDINLEFISGERHILLGPSGAGKTTLLRLLNRMEDPSSGEITYEGKNIKDIPVLELRRKVGMVFQIPVVFDGTVKENLMIPYRLGLITGNSDEKELENALNLAGLQTDFLRRNASSLSVGEKQRLNVARALINKPEVLLLDEPTSALDPESAMRLIHSIRELNEHLGLTVIMVTHQMEYAKLLGGRIIHIESGTIIPEKKGENLFLN
ncbi:MAG TPA: ATP-binding cassette domain-containing protein [Thermodesulfobacteriota bacterium]|nr:ATP-binding cassette domain-containing protein [Thermodesulfobacteriota bacterium]